MSLHTDPESSDSLHTSYEYSEKSELSVENTSEINLKSFSRFTDELIDCSPSHTVMNDTNKALGDRIAHTLMSYKTLSRELSLPLEPPQTKTLEKAPETPNFIEKKFSLYKHLATLKFLKQQHSALKEKLEKNIKEIDEADNDRRVLSKNLIDISNTVSDVILTNQNKVNCGCNII
jgi:DNA repair exonuclease SbcCD ATPase subunit